MTMAVPTTPAGAELAYIPAPDGAPADVPRIFQALNCVMRDVSPVAKDQTNTHQRYNFRGIDDLMSAVAGPMRSHGVFLIPQLVSRTAQQRGDKWTFVTVEMSYRLYGPAGDALVAVVPGEAGDTADKATNKAMSAALKYLLLQVLMIPVDARSIDDGDRDHPAPPAAPRQAEQQPRRTRQAEPGPWESAQPAAPDFLAEAKKAKTVEEVRAIWSRAKAAGSSDAGEIAEIGAAMGRRKPNPPRQAEQQPHAQAAPPANAAHDQALAEMHAAAEAAGLTPTEADAAFVAHYGHAPAEGTVAELVEQRDTLIEAAGGAQ
ncbi:ERF family protein [Streptomyces sp. NPDC059853]|uniref:ERF family protein n=1 Tax=Streptomyces sp. NPDC059853 TaxID=3346973 RepID=UPI00364D44AB